MNLKLQKFVASGWALLGSLAAALFWLAAALIVAFPAEALNLDVSLLSQKFLQDWNKLYVPLLLIVDIFISIVLLRDKEVQKRLSGFGVGILLMFGVLYVLLTVLLPANLRDADAWSTWLFFVAALCLIFARTQTYVTKVAFDKIADSA